MWRENKIIKIPAILSSFDKNNNIFPTVEAVAPKKIKTIENLMKIKLFLKEHFCLAQFRLNFSRDIRNIRYIAKCKELKSL